MKRKVQVENYEIIYTVMIKNVRNIHLHIQPNGEIVVSCNSYVPLEKIDHMVIEKYRWILEKVTQINQKRKLFDSEKYFVYLGKQYLIQPVLSAFTRVRFKKNICEVFYTEKKEVQQVLNIFERDSARKILSAKTDEVFDRMSEDYELIKPSLKIRKMKSRWGSCMPYKNQITLNQMLIHYNERFIEYVILHEIAHLIQPNHSKAFYSVIEKYMPDYKQVSKKGPNSILLNDEFVI